MNRRTVLASLSALWATLIGAGPLRSQPTRSEADVLYPASAGAPGAPFADPNLKLAVLDALMSDGRIDLGSPARLASHVLGREVDLEKERDFHRPVYDYLARYPLAAEQLASIETLAFDGGSEIYFYLWRDWDGETDEFNINSLTGIEHCVNLRAFLVASMLEDSDLAKLRPLQRLEEVELDLTEYRNGEALLELPNLRKLECFPDSIDRGVVDALRARGVAVKIYK